jgi:DNA-binding MarR family transcriptional regulator
MAERHVRGAITNELLQAARYATELHDRELRAVGVDPTLYGPLSFIGTLQPVTRTKLVEATGERRTTQRDTIRRLLESGHVREVPNPEDGRSTLLELTAEGQKVFDEGLPVFRRVLHRIDAELGGTMDEHEEAVWRVRQALQRLTE